MRIRSLHAIPVRLPRDIASSRGTAGSPTSLAGSGGYRWSTAYPVLYSVHFETALVRIELENGLVGWGEAQAPLAPEVACSIVTHLLRPALEGEDFDGRPERITELWPASFSRPARARPAVRRSRKCRARAPRPRASTCQAS